MLSISSLPSREGIGTLGAGAYAFVDFLAKSGFSVWQVLPLTPTREGNSPYSSISANALNPLFIDLFDLVKRGLLSESEIKFRSKGRVDYDKVIPEKKRLLRPQLQRRRQSWRRRLRLLRQSRLQNLLCPTFQRRQTMTLRSSHLWTYQSSVNNDYAAH